MPDGPVDPATLEGDDLVQWYRRTPTQVDQQREVSAAQQYKDFFGGLRDLQSSPEATNDQTKEQTPTFGFDPHLRSGLESEGLNGRPSTLFQAPGATSESPIGIASTSVLAASARPTQQPWLSSPAVAARPGPYARPDAGLLGALFPWAVPIPGRGTLKSARVTPGGMPDGPDPSRVDVFQRGPDGRLQPIAGWRTTGPFDFGKWTPAFDVGGIAHDVGHIADDVSKVFGVKATGEAFLDALGPGVRQAVDRGIFGPPGHWHHVLPKFLGGAADQELVDLVPRLHVEFHRALTSELRKAGSPPVGGKTGATGIWQQMFSADSAKRDKALEILRGVTRDFDIERGTSITPHLDRELAKMKVNPPPPPN